jgi:PAS domain S-box-containing protein
VSARLNSEEALRESEHRTRLIVSHALDAVITFDAQGHITSWNPQAESLFGWREDEAVGLLLTETVIPPVHREAVSRGLVRLAAGDEGRLLGRRIELTGFRRDGTELPLELAITPMPIGGKIVFSAFLRDITERKQSEERTAELARLARALTESLDMDTVTDRVVTSVVAVFKARAAFISLVEADGFLCGVALAGNPLNEFQRAYRSPPGVGMAGRAVAERRAVWTSDVLNEPGLEFQDEFRRAVAAANTRSVLVVPLRIKEDVIGVLALTDDKVRTFADDEIGRLQTFADHAALAIRNVQLFSTEQAARAKAATLAERLEVLHETDQAVISGEAPDAIAAKAVVRLRNLLGVPRAIVNLFDLAAGEVQWLAAAGRHRVHQGPGVRFPLSMMGDVEALRRGELQVVDVASLAPSGATEALIGSGISTYMVVPMIANGELLGGLSFGGEPGEYSAEQVSIAREVAAQLAIAVQQARLQSVKRHAEELTQRVQERTLELTDANEQLKRESADRERAEAVADRANRAKSEFLSRMSHELRTPLNGIIGFGQLLQLDALEPEQSESVEHILKGGRHLLMLINEVLDITRIEADTLSVSLEPVSSDEALRTALSLVRPEAALRMVTLREVASCDCFVMADRQRLHQVLLNLLSNAIKYNREGGSVEVSCTKTVAGRVRLAVSDTGHGISPAMLARLYTPFDRLGADELGIEGTGLGLALSKRLVEAMNGSLVVESRRGVGTTFTAELAYAEAPWAVSVGSEEMAADTGTPRARATVLYIEDNLANLRLVERIVARRPELTLISAMLGSQGLELARSLQPQAIILDLHLPDMFGGEVLAHLREDSRTSEIPVVILSADATPGQISRLLAQGAHAYLTKPLDVYSSSRASTTSFGRESHAE